VTREDGRCRFQGQDGLCQIHAETGESGESLKPRSCFISPWILTPKGKLIIRNRYRLLGCFKAEPRLPAYKAFRSGLQMLFGEEETERIVAHFDGGGGDLEIGLDRRREALVRRVMSEWHAGAVADRSQTEAGGQLEQQRRQKHPFAPRAITPNERHGGYWVKRDDLFQRAGARGGKVRTCLVLADGATGLVSSGGRESVQITIVARLAKELGLPCRIHVADGETTPRRSSGTGPATRR
jgi:hypothetical protein